MESIRHSRSEFALGAVKSRFPDAFLRPSSETSEHTVPLIELFRQIAPRRAGTDQPQDGIDELTLVFAVAALTAFPA
jgi:hypothetical protein